MKANFTRFAEQGEGSPEAGDIPLPGDQRQHGSEQVIGSCWVSGCNSQPRTRRQNDMILWPGRPVPSPLGDGLAIFPPWGRALW